MKQINDDKIIKLVKEDSNYNIKTTSQSILNQYEYEKSLEAKPTKKSHKNIITYVSLFSTLAAACAVLVGVIFIGNNESKVDPDTPIIKPDVNPESNKFLKKQLVTFSAFSSIDNTENIKNSGLLKAFKAQTVDNEDDEEEKDDSKSATEIGIKEAIDIYESVEKSVNYLYHDNLVSIKEKDVEANFDNIDYNCVSEFYFSNSETPFAYYYFVKDATQNNKKDEEKIEKAYYQSGDLGYNVDVTYKVENGSDELEKETKLVLRDVHKIDKKVYVIEKSSETEVEDGSTSNEESLDVITYANENDYKNKSYLKKVSSETDVENNENEINVKVKTKTYKASYDIIKVNESNLNLITSYTNSNSDIEFEDETIKLIYTENIRTYSWKESTWTF